ncbi:MAG TPA: AAA family ATPase [Kofleriaceae bacterium]|nr:AAA family ATPase [Kofleriaceae bacterium]
MYLRHLHVQNLKRLRDFKLDFLHAGQPRMWTVLIGENGTAKTTLLQAIALAAAGGQQVNTLAGPVVRNLRDRRSPKEQLEIDAEFEFTPSGRSADIHPFLDRVPNPLRLRSDVFLTPGSTSMFARSRYLDGQSKPLQKPVKQRAGYVVNEPLDRARAEHTRLWFVAGYGISRALPDASSMPPFDRPSIERMQPLFSAQAGLASTSFSNHFAKKDREERRKAGTTYRMFSRMLNKAIKLGGDDLLPGIAKLELRGTGGDRTATDMIESDRFHQRMGRHIQKIAGVALSHGYQSTLAWIADLIGHILLEAKDEVSTVDMEGLVLLDEIDLYLHPAWQATFVTALRRVFPKIQFVATTHSPVILAGLAPHEVVRLQVDAESGDVVRAAWDPSTGQVVAANGHNWPQPDPRPMTGSEIYNTWFGVDRLTPNPHGEALRSYLMLAEDPFRTNSEQKELVRLQKQLHASKIGELQAPVPRRSR